MFQRRCCSEAHICLELRQSLRQQPLLGFFALLQLFLEFSVGLFVEVVVIFVAFQTRLALLQVRNVRVVKLLLVEEGVLLASFGLDEVSFLSFCQQLVLNGFPSELVPNVCPEDFPVVKQFFDDGFLLFLGQIQNGVCRSFRGGLLSLLFRLQELVDFLSEAFAIVFVNTMNSLFNQLLDCKLCIRANLMSKFGF